MGMLSGPKKVAGILFNVKVNEWVGYDNIKSTSKFIASSAKDVFTPEHAEHTETFDEAVKRLDISDEDIKERIMQLTKIFISFMALAFAVFGYSIYLAFSGNILGFCISFALTIFTCTQAFKYHFWIFQMKKRKST